MSFREQFELFNWDDIQQQIHAIKEPDVRAALDRRKSHSLPGTQQGLRDFMALLSPAAAPFLEEMAALSRQITLQRFGRVMQMYIPLYLSNECSNICTYCGFSLGNRVPRITLGEKEILEEAKAVKSYGYDHVLLVTGESPKEAGMEYFERAIAVLRPLFSQISMEVQPLEEEEYRRLAALGVHGILVYQETYNEESYKHYHPKGKKSNFHYRLATPERTGAAGMHKVGLGTLLGLSDWRTDAWFTALHLAWLEKQFWKTRFSISFPRLRPAEGVASPKIEVNERELAQLICAWRIFNENADLSLSTRESPRFRDHAVKLGITTLSAGSRTEPGGYAMRKPALEQFDVCDNREPQEVADALRKEGFDPVWKDWEKVW